MKPRHLWKQPKRSPVKRSTKPIARESEKAKARRQARTGRVLTHEPANSKKANIVDSTIPEFRKRPKAKKKRTAAEERAKFEREYGPPGFLDWIHGQPSVASGKGPCVAAHLGTGGTSRKGDWTTIIPLTDHEHVAELHHRGPSWFEAKYDISLTDVLAATQRRWVLHCESLAVSHVPFHMVSDGWAIVAGRGGERG